MSGERPTPSSVRNIPLLKYHSDVYTDMRETGQYLVKQKEHKDREGDADSAVSGVN